MSEDEQLNLLKRKRLLELRRHYLEQQGKNWEECPQRSAETTMDPEKILKDLFVDRGWEVWEAAKSQFPKAAEEVRKAIVAANQSGRLKDRVSGEQLYWLFLRLGFRVRLQTHIRILESGEAKSIAQKLREG